MPSREAQLDQYSERHARLRALGLQQLDLSPTESRWSLARAFNSLRRVPPEDVAELNTLSEIPSVQGGVSRSSP